MTSINVLLWIITLIGGVDRSDSLQVDSSHPELRIKTGVLYLAKNPFTGTVIETYDSGTIKSRIAYRDGRKHGELVSWFRSGQKRTQRQFAEGKKIGVHRGWWESGGLKFEYPFKDDVYHGELYEWYENGTLASHYSYVAGRESGAQRAWRPNGKLHVNVVYKDGRAYGLFKAKPCYTVVDGGGQYGTSMD